MHPTDLAVNIGGIPHLAKNERDVGHPSFARELGKIWPDVNDYPSKQHFPQREYAYLRERRISSVRIIASAISRMAFRFCRLCFCNAR